MPICIVNESLNQMTEDCLLSMEGQYDELVIIDDGSTYPIEWIKEKADVWVENKENLGFVRSANKGFKAAHGEYIVLFCNDTRLEKGNLVDLCGEGYIFPRFRGKETPFWDGAFYGFPRKIGGLYDEKFQDYFGDLDLFFSAKKKGIPLERVDSVSVFHQEEQTQQALGKRQTVYDIDNEKFKKKHEDNPLQDYNSLT